MKEHLLWLVVVVAGGYAVKGLLLPAIAGPEIVTMISFVLGGLFVVSGTPVIAHAITEGDIPKLGKCAMVVILGIILMIG